MTIIAAARSRSELSASLRSLNLDFAWKSGK